MYRKTDVIHRSHRALSVVLVGLFCLNTFGTNVDVHGAERGKSQLLLGIGVYNYHLLPRDKVFPDGYFTPTGFVPAPGAFDQSLSQTFGFMLGYAGPIGRRMDLMWDIDFGLWNLNRHFTEDDVGVVVFGIQSYFGTRMALISNHLAFHTMIGINFLRIGGESGYTYSGSGRLYVYGTSGQEALWAKNLNLRYRERGQISAGDLESVKRVAPAMKIGFSSDILTNGIVSIRLSVDYIPVYDLEIRHDFRAGLAFVFWED